VESLKTQSKSLSSLGFSPFLLGVENQMRGASLERLTLLVGSADPTSLVAELRMLLAEETIEERMPVELEERVSVAELEEKDSVEDAEEGDSVEEVSVVEEVRELSKVVLARDEVARTAVVADPGTLEVELADGALWGRKRESAPRKRGAAGGARNELAQRHYQRY
jgi:hypothetical protein